MCGIVGFSWKDEEGVRSAVQRIVHRGPDDQGVFVDDAVSLGHVRLSILDLSPAGHQPFFDEETGRYIVFNGEIYNFEEVKTELAEYVFSSSSDTEVILKAYDKWGPDAVNHFNGMWAFCIYDPAKAELFLSRDRFGKKPLYYSLQGGHFSFASEVKALPVPFRVNKRMLSDYFYFDFMDHTDESFFAGIKKIPASSSAFFDLKKKSLKVWKYYHLGVRHDDFLELFDDACSLRTVSDVPVSLSLSGGVDSTAIGAMYAAQGLKLEAFTTVSRSGIGDETKKIALLRKRYPGVFNVHMIDIDIEDFVGTFRKAIYHLESPVVGGLLPRWSIAEGVRKAGFKVLICGEGADEMMGGYASAYPFVVAAEFRRGRFFSAVHHWWEGSSYFGRREYAFLGFYLLPRFAKAVAIRLASVLLRRKYGLLFDASVDERLRNAHFSDPKEYFEYGLWRGGIPLLLNYNDKIPMAHGVEVRAPFMDVRMVERILSMSVTDRVGQGYTKYFFRTLMSRKVPKGIVWDRTKIGFQSPTAEYLRLPQTQEFIKKAFRSPRSARFVDKVIFLRRYDLFLRGRQTDERFLLKVLSLELWMREFGLR